MKYILLLLLIKLKAPEKNGKTHLERKYAHFSLSSIYDTEDYSCYNRESINKNSLYNNNETNDLNSSEQTINLDESSNTSSHTNSSNTASHTNSSNTKTNETTGSKNSLNDQYKNIHINNNNHNINQNFSSSEHYIVNNNQTSKQNPLQPHKKTVVQSQEISKKKISIFKQFIKALNNKKKLKKLTAYEVQAPILRPNSSSNTQIINSNTINIKNTTNNFKKKEEKEENQIMKLPQFLQNSQNQNSIKNENLFENENFSNLLNPDYEPNQNPDYESNRNIIQDTSNTTSNSFLNPLSILKNSSTSTLLQEQSQLKRKVTFTNLPYEN